MPFAQRRRNLPGKVGGRLVNDRDAEPDTYPQGGKLPVGQLTKFAIRFYSMYEMLLSYNAVWILIALYTCKRFSSSGRIDFFFCNRLCHLDEQTRLLALRPRQARSRTSCKVYKYMIQRGNEFTYCLV